MDVTIRDLKYFLATAEAGSLSEAAHRCFVTQPALSKSIARIESVMEQKLFLRSRKGMALTSAGDMFLGYAARACREFEEAARYVRSSREGEGGLLRIGATRPVFDAMLSKAVIELVNEAPDVCFELELGAADDLLEMLEEARLDMVLGPLKTLSTPSLDVHPLGTDNVCVIGRAEHPVFELKKIALNQLVDFHWILPKQSSAALQWFIESFHKKGLLAPRPTIEVNYAGVPILNIIASTDLLSYVPGTWNVELPKGLKRLHVPELDSIRTIYLATRKDTSWSPVMTKMRQILESFSEI